MAGLLDYLTSGALLQGFFPEQNVRDIRPRADTPLFDINAGQGADGWQINLGRPGSLTGDTFDQRFGAMQPPAQQQAAPAPQMQSPTQAQQGLQFDMPTSTYAFGGQMVPAFGQSQPVSDEISARPRGGSVAVPNDPTTAQPSFSSELFATPKSNSFASKMDELIGVLNPSIGASNDSKVAQRETAKGLYEIFKSRGMPDNVAAANAVIAARNPEVLKEQMSRFKNIEEKIANQQGPAGQSQSGLGQITDLKQAEELGKKRADAESNRETLRLSLPALQAEAKDHIRQVEQLVNHQGRKGNVWWHGKGSSFLPDATIPGNTAAGDAVNLMNQIKGGAFLEAFKALKGGGQITEIEGKKATDAMNRMNRSTSEKEFNDAAAEYVGAIRRGLDKLHAEAGASPPNNYRGRDGWSVVPMPGSSAPVRIRQVQ